MDAIEKRAREPNPNVSVIHEAMQHFPEDSWMRGALDHAAAELAVLHSRNQRAALTPPEGYVLVPVEPTEEMQDAYRRKCLDIDLLESLYVPAYKAMIDARPEVS